jgi:hypothetical protein
VLRYRVKSFLLVHTIAKNYHMEESFMSLNEKHFSPAKLEPNELEEIQAIEQLLSSKFGHSISLVAYQAEPKEEFVD